MTGAEDQIPPRDLSQERFDAWRELMEPIEPFRFVAHAAPSHLLFQNGKTDRLVPAADAKDYQESGSEPKTILWYEDGHGITPERVADQLARLEKRIGIDASRYARN